jgi:hypothetical protein
LADSVAQEQKRLEGTLRARVRDLEQAAEQRNEAHAASAAELERVQRRLKSLESKLIEVRLDRLCYFVT